jgi:hypothetical protein
VRLPTDLNGRRARAEKGRSGVAAATRSSASGRCATATIRATSTGARALAHALVLRERAREMRRDVAYAIDTVFDGEQPDDDWTARFERRIRDVASRVAFGSALMGSRCELRR